VNQYCFRSSVRHCGRCGEESECETVFGQPVPCFRRLRVVAVSNSVDTSCKFSILSESRSEQRVIENYFVR
jgi:hypothetical protein